MKRLIFYILCGLIGFSCSEDTFFPADDSDENANEVLIKLTLLTPASSFPCGQEARAASIDAESMIREIQLLVFEEGTYRYRTTGISIANSPTHTTFSARLRSSDSPLKLLILANANTDLLAREPASGADEATVRASLTRTFAAEGVQTPLPMYGEYTLPSGLHGSQVNTLGGIQLIRAIARIDVQTGEATGFALRSLQVFRAHSQIQLIPEESALTVSRPSVPAGSTPHIQTVPIAVEGADTTARCYLPESAAPAGNPVSEATCLVIGGIYPGQSTPTYYRIDFNPHNENGTLGQILRNHRYIFRIKNIWAPGWETPAEAANNRSAYIEVEVEAWNEVTTDMFFDGEHHIGVSSRLLVVENQAGATGSIEVDTDLTDYTLQWADASGNPSGGESETLSNAFFKVEKTDQGKQLQVTALSDNSSALERRTAYLTLNANRWRVLLTLQQKYEPSTLRIINMLTFSQGYGYLGTNRIVPDAPAHIRSNGLRGILGNPANFGPDGRVPCGGYNLYMTNTSPNKLTDELFATADVIYVHYMATGLFGSTDARRVHNWVKARPDRVLIVSFDAADVSVNLMNEIAGGTSNLRWYQTNTGAFPLQGKAADNYFTDRGPFTTLPYTPVAAGFAFRNNDSYHGEIAPAGTAGITPILGGPGGGLVLGIDYDRRIVYCGDVDLGYTATGTGGNNDNHILNTTGLINNDASKLIANLFARITEIVLSGDN